LYSQSQPAKADGRAKSGFSPHTPAPNTKDLFEKGNNGGAMPSKVHSLSVLFISYWPLQAMQFLPRGQNTPISSKCRILTHLFIEVKPFLHTFEIPSQFFLQFAGNRSF